MNPKTCRLCPFDAVLLDDFIRHVLNEHGETWNNWVDSEYRKAEIYK